MESTLLPFVIVGLQPWDTAIGSNCKNIALELSKHTKVLYINIPLDWNTVLKNSPENRDHIAHRKSVRKGKTDKLIEVETNLFVFTPSSIILSINMFPPGAIYDYFNWRNNRKLAFEVKPVLAKLGFDKFYLFNIIPSLSGIFYLNNIYFLNSYVVLGLNVLVTYYFFKSIY